MDRKPRVLLLGDRTPAECTVLNLGDRAFLDGARRVLEEDVGCEILSGPWKPFPYFTYRRLSREARTHGVPGVLDRWCRTTIATPPDAARREAACLRWMDRTRVLNNPLVRRLETRVASTHGLGLLQALRPYLFRNGYAAAVMAAMREADAVLFLGGGLFADHLLTYMPAFLFEVVLATRLGCKVVAASQTVSVTDRRMLEAVTYGYAGVRSVLLREPVSLERLSALPLPRERMGVCPDLAFAVETARCAPRLASCPAGTVGLVIRGDRDADEDGWVRLVCRLTSVGYRVQILFTCEAQDKALAMRLAGRCPLVVSEGARGYRDVIGRMGECALVVTDRFHAVIFAILAGTPVVPLRSRTFKTDGLFRMFDYPVNVLPELSAQTWNETAATVERAMARPGDLRAAVQAARAHLTVAARETLARAVREALA